MRAKARGILLFVSVFLWTCSHHQGGSSSIWTAAQRHQIQALYQSAIQNTDQQISIESDGTAYVKTGDIPAQWLRDSSAQVRPYLFEVKQNPARADLLRKVILRQARAILINPYANAFRADYSIWEEKFELDSLAYPLLLAWTYWKTTGDTTPFTIEVKTAYQKILETLIVEQDHNGLKPGHKPSHYSFQSDTQTSPRGPFADTGMIWTAFRPSDDPCEFPFLIPSEMMMVQALKAMAEVAAEVFMDAKMAEIALKLRLEIHHGIQKFGVLHRGTDHAEYAYEVDGLGRLNQIDDANLPSLLSAPYFGYPSASDPIYQRTRQRILSSKNPYYYAGRWARGVGSPHTPAGMIWPLALIAQGLTSTSAQEQRDLLPMILASDLGDHRLHESFDPNDPRRFTREDFGWPNALFAEFYLTAFQGEKSLPVPAIADLDWKTGL